jgi:hypothetical protein
MTIIPTFSSSITSRSNASTIENAFNAAAKQFDTDFANPAVVRITVSWGSVGGQSLGAGDIGSSIDNLSGPYSFTAVTNDLKAVAKANPTNTVLATAAADLPKTDPTKKNAYEVPYAEAKAMGLLPPTLGMTDGYIGFSSTANFDFNPVGGISTGAYDFEGLAAHEIEEVMGRTTGLESSSASWGTPFDLYRYSSVGVSNFSYTSKGYFSIDGGHTDLGDFNNTGAGDRSDWLSSTGMTDLQSAYLSTGVAYGLSKSDLTALDALGWGAFGASGLSSAGPSELFIKGAAGGVPEPSTWAVLLTGLGLVGVAARRRRAQPAAPAMS